MRFSTSFETSRKYCRNTITELHSDTSIILPFVAVHSCQYKRLVEIYMNCLTPQSAIVKTRRLFNLSGHHLSACRLACGIFETGNGRSYWFAHKSSLTTTCMGTVVREGVRSSVNVGCARDLALNARFRSSQRQPCHRGSIGRCSSTRVSSGTSGIYPTESKEVPQRSPFAPRTRIRQIKVLRT